MKQPGFFDVEERLARLSGLGDQKSQMSLFVWTVGVTRATMWIGLANIVYNMRRFLLLERITPPRSNPESEIITLLKT
mgnify:CR=1 FL=1